MTVTFKKWVMKTNEGYVMYDIIRRTWDLSLAKLYDLTVVPEPKDTYCFVPVQITIEELIEGK